MTLFGPAIAVLGALLLFTASPAGAVGFQWGMASDPDGSPLQVAIWYPSDAATRGETFGPIRQPNVARDGAIAGRGLPLVIFSHGTGGMALNSYDTAIALAEAGFIVASVTHSGDNYRDNSDAFTQANFVNRPRQISRVIDYMLADWSGHEAIDPAAIGILGHSAGATTALIAIGGKPDWRAVVAFCATDPDDWGCRQATQQGVTRASSALPTPIISGTDRRIKAAVVAAPAIAAGFTSNSLAEVKVPVQLWIGSDDDIATGGDAIRSLLPVPPDYHLVPHAGHFAYLAPCSESLAAIAPEICRDPAGFDRAAFLHEFQRE